MGHKILGAGEHKILTYGSHKHTCQLQERVNAACVLAYPVHLLPHSTHGILNGRIGILLNMCRFLLVRFYIEHLCQQTSAGQILAALEALKKSTSKHDTGPLDFIYERAIETIHSQHGGRKNLALNVLSWLVKAKQTLTFDELQEAVCVEHQRYELN